MQEEIENRTVNLAISTTKLTARGIIRLAAKGLAYIKRKSREAALKNEKPDTAYTLLSTIETKFRDNGFTTRRAGKEDLKRLLAIYFEQNTTTERFEDYDGQRFLEVV